MRVARVLAVAGMLAAVGCDGANSTPDAGGDNGVLYETCPSECPTPPRCAASEIATCCVCVERPARVAGRTECGLMSEYCDESPVDPLDVACLKPDGWPDPPPDSPPAVTVRGVVDVYGNGNPQVGGDILVEFFRVGADQLPEAAPVASYTATLAACSDALLPPIREDTLEAECCPGPCQELMPDVDDCTPASGDCRPLWYYEVSGIPTYTPLVARTSGNPGFWKDIYAYNLFFFESDVEPGESYAHYRLRALSVDDWMAIPAAAGDFDGIAPGAGAVAGEIHDCDNVKLYNVQAGTSPVARTFTYFNGVEEKPYPDRGRLYTNLDSIYAAMEIDPGPVRVTALAQVDGEGIVNLGWWDGRIFADALTILSIRGTRPSQVPVR